MIKIRKADNTKLTPNVEQKELLYIVIGVVKLVLLLEKGLALSYNPAIPRLSM
jgi:hypothetical protein